MKYIEYGSDNKDTLIFLHGGGLSWWNFREEAELLQQDFHVILPILDGHADSGRLFTTIEDAAAELIRLIDERFGGSVLLIGGLSLGAQILLETLSQKNDVCRIALVESAAVLPSKLTHALVGSAVSGSYGLIRKRGFAQKQFNSLHIRQDLFEDYYRDTCKLRKEDMIAFMKANTAYSLKDQIKGCSARVAVFYGEKENREIRESAKAIRSALPDCRVSVVPDAYHGEFSLNRAKQYAGVVKKLIDRELTVLKEHEEN